MKHPRPHFKRDNWLPLNGQWEFEFDDSNVGEVNHLFSGKQQLNKKINVPFSYQTKASGVNEKEVHEYVWYRKEIDIKKGKNHVILGFNAVFYQCDVWVNGFHATRHCGGYSAFTVDVTDFVKDGSNIIVVKCYAPLNPSLSRGKQTWTGEPFSCWYTPSSGIWQSVWIDLVGEDYLDDYSLTPNIDNNSFYGDLKTRFGIANKAMIRVFYKNNLVKENAITLDGEHTKYTVNLSEESNVDETTYWWPECPNLYYVDFVLYKDDEILDTVHTRFGMRKISVSQNGEVLLNNKHLYQRLILDQGYWKDSGFTAPSEEALKEDIIACKKMGFNGARKHQKIEDPYFYYYADELGLLVWGEMPSAYKFNNDEVYNYLSEWQKNLSLLTKFVSVIAYVPLNESWGVRKMLNDKKQQSLARALYFMTKAIDDSRLVSTNDGWENISNSDIISVHDYSLTGDEFSKYTKESIDSVYQTYRRVFAEGEKYNNQPLLLSEFGGVSVKSSLKEGCWGYNDIAKNEEELLNRISCLVKKIKNTCFQGYCYTQLTDVQQEVNGLLDENHCPKFSFEKLNEIFGK